MQWTMDQIVKEYGHIDAQILSYLERCIDKDVSGKGELKVFRKWFKATSNFLVTMLAKTAECFPTVHVEVVDEQDERWTSRVDEPQGRIVPPHVKPR